MTCRAPKASMTIPGCAPAQTPWREAEASASSLTGGRPRMGFRFYRGVSIIPGVRVNLSRRGPSLSIGHRGAWYTIGPRGRRVTLGLPGTGLYWTERIPPAAAPHAGHRTAFVLCAFGLLWARQTIVESGRGRKAGGGDSLLSWGVVVLGMIDEDSLQKLEKRNAAILPQLGERQRRSFARAEAQARG